MASSPPPPSSLAVDVAAAAKALDEVAAAGGAARLVMNREGGTSLVIQVTNDNKGKIEKAQSAIKTLTSNSALKAANENEERDRKIYNAKREKMMTPLMKAARDDKDGRVMQKEIQGVKAGTSGGMLEKILNEIEKAYVIEEDDVSGEDNNIDADGDSNNEKVGPTSDGATTSYAHIAKSACLPKEGGWAAIHFACDSGNHEGLRYLLEAGADPNLTERMGATPLHRVILGAGKYPLTQLRSGNITTTASVDSGSKMALPGVVKSKSVSGTNKKGEAVIDNKYLDDYMKCLKLLLDDNRFNLMMSERKEEEFRASKQGPLASDKNKFGKGGLPEDDGFGISPLCLCVSQGYTARDALYPLLEHLLTRGFDPNATMCGVSALHIALRNAHYGCAFALTRAGANINTLHPDGKTALQASELIYGESFARELREASVVAMAVADPTRRRDLLRSQGEDGAKKARETSHECRPQFYQGESLERGSGRVFGGSSVWAEEFAYARALRVFEEHVRVLLASGKRT
mmetsp:Transcript_7965/g.17274  ORF Transcript_7965/g.17274 Transcript_7965/m.17274 type:complete len:518 (-) Transcript_7965:886-2439(-)